MRPAYLVRVYSSSVPFLFSCFVPLYLSAASLLTTRLFRLSFRAMGTVSPYKAPWALALSICLCLCNALPSVPIATDPILSTATVSTIVPSLVTIYSVVPATDSPNALKTITTTVNGRETVLTTADVVAGSSTATIISTISLTQNQVVVSTIGYSTILGPDPAPVVSPASLNLCQSPSTMACGIRHFPDQTQNRFL